MRTFDTGATRDDNTDKLNPVRGLSVQVEQRYLEYLRSHRLQKNGSLRDWDNWKRGVSVEAYRESLNRHVRDAVRASMGLPVPDNASLIDLLCAIRFNVDGWLFELLAAKSGNREGVVTAADKSRTCGECNEFGPGRCYYNDGAGRARLPSDISSPNCFTPKKPA